jgi:hypothetical protein
VRQVPAEPGESREPGGRTTVCNTRLMPDRQGAFKHTVTGFVLLHRTAPPLNWPGQNLNERFLVLQAYSEPIVFVNVRSSHYRHFAKIHLFAPAPYTHNLTHMVSSPSCETSSQAGRDQLQRVRTPFMAVRRKPVFAGNKQPAARHRALERFGLRLQAINRLRTR